MDEQAFQDHTYNRLHAYISRGAIPSTVWREEWLRSNLFLVFGVPYITETFRLVKMCHAAQQAPLLQLLEKATFIEDAGLSKHGFTYKLPYILFPITIMHPRYGRIRDALARCA